MFRYGEPLVGQTHPFPHQDRRHRGGYSGGHPGSWIDEYHDAEYEYDTYRQPSPYHERNYNYPQRSGRYPTPEPMSRMGSSSVYSNQHLPRRSGTPFPGRGYVPSPNHHASPQGSYHSDRSSHYPEAYGRGYDMSSRGQRQWPGQDPAYSTGYPIGYDPRYPEPHPGAGRMEGSWIGGQLPRSSGGHSSHQRPLGGGLYQDQQHFPPEDYYEEENDIEHIHDARNSQVRGQYIKQSDGGFRVSEGIGNEYELGGGPVLKGAYPRQRGTSKIGYSGSGTRPFEDDSGYGSDEGESLVSEDWDGMGNDQARYRQEQGVPPPPVVVPTGSGSRSHSSGGWHGQRISGAPWPGGHKRPMGGTGGGRFRDDWR